MAVWQRGLFLIFGFSMLAYGVLRLYPNILNVFTGVQSIDKVVKDVPKGNVHWDKSQQLFNQMRAENDIEKVKKLNDQNIQELKAVLDTMPNNARVWDELGNAYTWINTVSGKQEDALAAFQKAESLDPNNFVYINAVGNQLIAMERYNDAVLEFQKAVRAGSNDYTYLGLARAYRGAKIYDSAKQYYQKTIDGFSSHNSGGKWDSDILTAQQEMAALPK